MLIMDILKTGERWAGVDYYMFHISTPTHAV